MKLWAGLSSLALLSGCTITLPDVKVCAVAGMMSAGSDCAYTISGETSSMDLNQWIEFLEPQVEPARGAAMCMSSSDFAKIKTVIEQACKKLGTSCTKEAKANLSRVSTIIDELQDRVRKKKHGPKN